MSSNNNYKSSEPPFDLEDAHGTIFRQMGKGLLIASAVFFGPVIFIVFLAWVGSFLPPESKEAADPSPDSFPIIMEMEEAAEEDGEEDGEEEESSDG